MIDYHKMRQYNRIMLGEGGKYIQDCLEHNYIGVNFIKEEDLTSYPHNDENSWRHHMIAKYLECNPDLSSTYKCNFLGADNKQ